MGWLPLRSHEIFIERRIQCHSRQLQRIKNAWNTITAKLKKILRNDSRVNLALKSSSGPALMLASKYTFPSLYEFKKKSLLSTLLMLSRGTRFYYFQYCSTDKKFGIRFNNSDWIHRFGAVDWLISNMGKKPLPAEPQNNHRAIIGCLAPP